MQRQKKLLRNNYTKKVNMNINECNCITGRIGFVPLLEGSEAKYGIILKMLF